MACNLQLSLVDANAINAVPLLMLSSLISAIPRDKSAVRRVVRRQGSFSLLVLIILGSICKGLITKILR
jgi:hypothetical protein